MGSVVALTFDDGPSGSTTPELLEILADAQVPATFFMLGSQVAAFPQLTAEVAAAGHEIGNHSWSHPYLTTLPTADIRAEITRTTEAIVKVTGRAPTLFRPPYGATNSQVAAAAEGMTQILWTIDTRDWDHHDPAQTVAAARAAGPGAIILMHDSLPATIEAAAAVIDAVRDSGLTPVTVSQLLGTGAR